MLRSIAFTSVGQNEAERVWLLEKMNWADYIKKTF